MKTLRFYLLAFTPIFVMICLALCIELFKFDSSLASFKSLCFIGFTVLCGLILYFTVLKLGMIQKAPNLQWGKIRPAIAIGILTSVAVALGGFFHSFFNGIALNFQFTKWTPSFFWFSSSLLAPVIEEFAFRAGLLRLLLPAMRSQYAIVFSAAAFASLHVLNIILGSQLDVLQILGCFLIGIILGVIYLRHGLLSAIAFHWCWNLTQIPVLRGMLDTRANSITMFEGLPGVLIVLVVIMLILNFKLICALLGKTLK